MLAQCHLQAPPREGADRSYCAGTFSHFLLVDNANSSFGFQVAKPLTASFVAFLFDYFLRMTGTILTVTDCLCAFVVFTSLIDFVAGHMQLIIVKERAFFHISHKK